MYGYNAGQPMAIPIYTVLPYCVITEELWPHSIAEEMKGTKVLTLGAGREVLPHNMAVTKMYIFGERSEPPIVD